LNHAHLEKDEQTELEQLIKSGRNSARVISRARVLLLLDRSQGKKNTIQEVVENGMVSQGTVYNVKQHYFAEGLAGALYDKPRTGRPIVKTTGVIEAHLVAIACSDPPQGQARWTLRLLADKLVELEVVDNISHVTVGSTLKKMKLSLGK